MEAKDHDKWLHRIALTMLPGIGDGRARRLVAYCGGVSEVFAHKRPQLLKVPGIGEVLADAIVKADLLKEAEKELRFVTEHGIRPLFFLDAGYPHRLLELEDSPVLLYTKGEMDLNAPRMLSVVGTRKATAHGKAFTDELIEGLAPTGVTIVSGLAYGIDIAAHRAALKHGLPTVACLAHGLDRIYPDLHRRTAEEMLDHGGWVSDFCSGTLPSRDNFPSRNRIIAGLADATIVIEAADSGGALITADIAQSYNRDVFAVPGRPGDLYSVGCNRIINQNKAALITSAAELISAMSWDVERPTPVQRQMFVEVSEEQRPMQQLLAEGPMRIDLISSRLGMPMSKVSAMLTDMELAGAIESLPGKVYRLA